jgi:Domain of unknown function (DUF4062)
LAPHTPYQGDAFISYAHLDNVELVEGRKGWVANLHRALEIRVAQLLGKSPEIWRDPKLSGNDLFADTIIERLGRVAILVAVVSPRYLKSEWTIREFSEFWSAAERQGGIRVRDKARVFKVLKTPVALDRTSPEMKSLLGYEFFSVDPETGKVRELDEVFGPEAQRQFWLRLDDLAHDICTLLEMLEAADGVTGSDNVLPADDHGPTPVPASAPSGLRAAAPRGTVYLAETTSDLRDQREALRRDLLQHGYQVLPEHTLPHVADEALAAIQAQLARSRMSIHLIGRHYGVVPEGGELSLIELQHELATTRGQDADFSRLIWIPAGLQVQDERQRRIVDRMRTDPRIGDGADLLETYFEDLRTAVQDCLTRSRTPPPAPEPPAGSAELPRVYLMADERDVAALDPWADALFDEGFEVIRPVYDGDEREIREFHEDSLASCDSAVIFYGSGNELWLRRKLRELQKAAGYGRTKASPTVGICLIGPRTAEKERFRTHEATVLPQWDGADMSVLRPLVAAIKARGVR